MHKQFPLYQNNLTDISIEYQVKLKLDQMV